MREIKFRGYDADTKQWYYGSLWERQETTYCFAEDYNRNPENTQYYILFSQMTDWCLPNRQMKADVVKESIGQYTGLKDKNGKEIYEGDIVTNEWCFSPGNSVVRFGAYKDSHSSKDYPCGHYGFYLEHPFDNYDVLRHDMMYFADNCEIIGNIYENPDLIKESD